MYKNGFAIFSGAVAVGSKRGLMVQVAVRAVKVAVWAVAAYIWAVTASMWAATSSMSFLQPLCMMCRCYVGCYILYVVCYMRRVTRYRLYV